MAVELKRGRPKLEISRTRAVTVRVTDFEFEKISRLAEKLKISKTEAVVRGINLLERDKPKILRSQLNKQKNIQPKIEKNSVGVIEGETVMFDK